MIGRESIQNLTSIQDVDGEITNRQTRLNRIAASIEPQILSEEIVELRLRRVEIEDQMVDELSNSTGLSAMECRTRLLKNRWNMDESLKNITFIGVRGYGTFFGEYGRQYHFTRSDGDEKVITAICGYKLDKRGGYKEGRIIMRDHVCPRCVELGLQSQGVEHVEKSVRVLS